ncbi:hypothetical protein A1D29_01920 [Pasteurellaceae bacterium Orientalotternb1]|nr:hypothetical protein A1D29_01920 [Pasteurellaceae bacterium Orientalotternb1]
MKVLRNLFFPLLISVVSCGLFSSASASSLGTDPFVREAIVRENFEPGGKYSLFNNIRGKVGDRTGNVGIAPIYHQHLGNLEMEKIGLSGKIGFVAHFSDHGYDEHSPFDNYDSRSASDEKGSVLQGFTLYKLDWTGHEHHPADGYDGPQGGGYPSPKGARDIYTYDISGIAQRIKLNSRPSVNDDRPWDKRLSDHVDSVAHNFNARAQRAYNKITEHNPKLNAWGNAAEAANGLIEGVIYNPIGAATEAVGINKAVSETGKAVQEGVERTTIRAIASLSTDGKSAAIDRLARGDRLKDNIVKEVSDFADDNPNLSEIAKLIGNAAIAKGCAQAAVNTAKNASISGAKGRVKEFVRSERGSSKPESKGTHKGAVSTAAAKGSQSGSNVSSSSAQAKVKQGSGKSSTSPKASATAAASAASNKVGGSGRGSSSLAQSAAVGTATTMGSVKPIVTRPTPKQSEIDVGKTLSDKAKPQISYKDGEEASYGKAGSVRPDWCDGNCSIEVKNYNIHTNRNNLIQNIAKQAKARAKHLPKNMKQEVRIDLRGQKFSPKDIADIKKRIETKTNGIIKQQDVKFIIE